MIRNFFKKPRVIATGVVLALTAVATFATSTIGQSPAAHAQSADCNLNIMCDGLSGSNAQAQINSFKTAYQNGTDGHYTDLRAVYQTWMGASPTTVSGMNTTNTVLGTVYKNGQVKVGNAVVATNAVITARFSKAGFTHVEGDVYSRPVTTYEYYDALPALVYMQNGKMVFFVEIQCGNAGKGTPVTPPTPPTAKLVCTKFESFDGSTDDKTGDVTQGYHALATGTNAVPTQYTFNLGAGHGTQVVPAGSNPLLPVSSREETYKPGNYTASVTVQGAPTNGAVVPPAAVTCSLPFNFPPPEVGTLACTNFTLNKQKIDDKTGNMTATLSATVKPSDPSFFTTYSYAFSFGKNGAADEGTQTVTTNKTTATSDAHVYKPGNYTDIQVVITGKTMSGDTVTATGNCKTNVTIPSLTCAQNSSQSQCAQPMCTAPNGSTHPVGSPECNTVVLTSQPVKLVNTGPGQTIALFGAVTIGGAILHNWFLRRRLANANVDAE